jgi:4-hydroxy-tetrahydrodipicolinate synthase
MLDGFSGVFVALVTPMTQDGELDLSALRGFVEHLIECGVHGVIPLGSTGEFYALDAEERRAVLTATLDTVAARVPVLVGTNAGSTREVIAHCQVAAEEGADGVLLAAPYYSLPSDDELFQHFARVEKAIDLPIMLYNYPDRTGVDLTPDLIARLAELDGIQYVKESSGEASRITEIIQRCGDRIDVFCGSDGIALESLERGAVGWVAGAANILPAELVQLVDLAAEEGRHQNAQDLYDRLLPLLSELESGKYTQKVKAGCELTGHPVGPPRGPLMPLATEELERLRTLLPAT